MAKMRILTDKDLNTTLPTLDEKGKVVAEQLPKIDTFPTGGTNGQVLKADGEGGVIWGQDNDTVYTHPTTHPPTIITQDATNRFVSDAEKNTWNGKQDKLIAGTNITIAEDGKTISATDKDTITTVNGKAGAITKDDIVALGIPGQDTNTTYDVATTSVNGLMSSADKVKLNDIEAGAQKNTVTSVHGRIGTVTISKSDVGLGSVENIGIKILTQVQYNALSPTEKARADILYAISG